MILADFRCPIHGVFEALADRDAESAPCPAMADVEVASWVGDDGELQLVGHHAPGPVQLTAERCNASSPWTPSPVFGRMQLVTASQGKSDPKPHKMSMDLREVGEGRSLNDWKKERRKMWRDHDYKKRKDEGRIP